MPSTAAHDRPVSFWGSGGWFRVFRHVIGAGADVAVAVAVDMVVVVVCHTWMDVHRIVS